MAYTAAAVIAEARKWNGYCEKKSMGTDAQMQNKTWNAGKNNYTWFWLWLQRKGCLNLQGGAWCDGFVDFIHAQVAGVEKAKKSLNGWSGYTPTSANNYKKAGRWINAGGEPKAGDQIFFKNSVRIYHTGIVTKVTGSTVYTIEGNTSGAAGVVENGGCVAEKSYSRKHWQIAGYGRPLYDDASEVPVSNAADNSKVKQGQKWLNDNYGKQLKEHCGGLLPVDGDYGTKTRAACVCVWKDVVNRKHGFGLTPSNPNFLGSCKTAAKKVQLEKGNSGTLVYLVQLVLAAKGYYTGTMDGIFGSGMKEAVKAFQSARKLAIDGVVGVNTWNALFN